ncbi:MAG: flagellar M-ring protein FliF [Proteobacteria bacterium]|nr:flagellar M-ring protein FliF [Pseudomonadota bacterium]
MNPIVIMLRNLGMPRLAAMGVVGVLLIGFFIFLAGRVTTSQMSLLYGDLDLKDSGQIVTELESRNIPFEIRANGAQIYVATDEVQRARVALAQEGLPIGGSLGYEIFDRGGSLGTTSFVQNINLVRALEGELARTIRSFSQVNSARVHLVLPRRELFSRNVQKPTASIVVGTRGPGTLERGQVQAIQHLVAAAVPGLTVGRISIIDQNGALLARGRDDEEGVLSDSDSEEFRAGVETRLRTSIERLLERTVGFGNVRAEVAADIDFDRVTESAEIYDPDGQVVRSTQTIEDSAVSTDRDGQAPVTVAGNLPNAAAETDGTTSSTRNTRTEETVNFEISRTTTTKVYETAIIERLTVAVLVDGSYETNAEGEKVYLPRTEDELQQLGALVRSTIGFDESRGDTVEIINMQFAVEEIPEEITKSALFGLQKEDFFEIAEFILIAIVAVLVILLVLRPLVARAVSMMAASAQAAADAAQQMQLESSEAAAAAAALAAPEAASMPRRETASAEIDSMIDISAVEGQVRASSVTKIGEIIDKHPDEALSILRTWLYQE